MTYDFFAAEQDKIDILNFIFAETDLRIFDHSSPLGQKVNEYKSTDEVTAKFDLQAGGKFAITFKMWSPTFKAELIFEKVDLNPKHCKGHTFRYCTQGWGLIQLYFGGIENNHLSPSHIGHFNQKGALKWEGINLSNGKVNNWDWPEIEKTSRKLKYQIHNKLVVKKIGARGVLKAAEALQREGFLLGV
jgi:hypothetical protein